MKGALTIAAAEVFSPIGLDLVQTATSVLTGISRVSASSLMDERFAPVTMGLVPEEVTAPLHEALEGVPYLTALSARLLRLASPCLENLAPLGLPLAEMPMFLALPAEQADRKYPVHEQFFEHLKIQSGISFNCEKSRAFRLGRAGFFFALKEAANALDAEAGKEKVDHVLVGGVDSMFDPMTIARYLSENRILREGVMDGFTPGEGAALLVLSRRTAALHLPSPALARLDSWATGNEEGHRYSDSPYRGDGLSEAVSEMFEKADGKADKVATVFAGFNGESFPAKEWSVAFVRNRDRFLEDYHIEHPAEYMGDTGAASPSIAAAVGAFGLRHNVWKGPLVLWDSSDYAERGAALLSTADE